MHAFFSLAVLAVFMVMIEYNSAILRLICRPFRRTLFRKLRFSPILLSKQPFSLNLINYDADADVAKNHGCQANQISETLKIHALSLLTATLSQLMRKNCKDISTENLANLTDNVFNQIISSPQYNSSNRIFYNASTVVCKALINFPVEKLSTNTSISDILSHYQSHLRLNKAVFDTITSHHMDIAKNGLAFTKDSLQKYAEAAERMGTKAWVIEGNDWMQSFALSYFRKNGARRFFLKKMRSLGNYSAELESLPKDLLSPAISSEEDEKLASMAEKIRILDVGSCYNPIAKSEMSGAFDVTAIDLYPADSSVLECNFLDLKVSKSPPMIDHVPGKSSQKILRSLTEASYDAVSMSLVLSYLPTPTERLAMIRKARQLLVAPGHKGQPHRAGVLLIVEKESIFGKENEKEGSISGPNRRVLLSQWKNAICAEGFELLFHRLQTAVDGKRFYCFAFSTSNHIPETVSDANSMWIKHDFNLASSVESPSQNSQVESSYRSKRNSVVSEGSANPLRVALNSLRTERRKEWLSQCLPVGIVGGGLGGSALAVALQKQGIPFLLFEKDASFSARKQGYALTMQQGGAALKSLGLGDAVVQQGAVSTLHSSFRWDGQPIGAYGAARRALDNWDAAGMKDMTYNRGRYNVHIPRQKLREILIENIPPERIMWRKKLLSFEKLSKDGLGQGEYLRLRFDDTSEYEVSLLVGADGVFSTVFQLILQRNQHLHSLASNRVDKSSDIHALEEAMKLRYLGLMVILGISPLSSSLLQNSDDPRSAWLGQRQWLDGSTRVFTMPFNRSKTMWQLSFPMDEADAMALSTASTNSKGQDVNLSGNSSEAGVKLKRRALQQCSGWDSQLIALIESTADGDLSGHPVYDRDPIDPSILDPTTILPEVRTVDSSVSTGLVTLLGDAAHPMSPFKGQGANQALVDALQLCNALVTTDYFSNVPQRRSVEAALREFEKEMSERSRRKVLKSREAASLLHQPAAVLAVGNITRARAAEDFDGR